MKAAAAFTLLLFSAACRASSPSASNDPPDAGAHDTLVFGRRGGEGSATVPPGDPRPLPPETALPYAEYDVAFFGSRVKADSANPACSRFVAANRGCFPAPDGAWILALDPTDSGHLVPVHVDRSGGDARGEPIPLGPRSHVFPPILLDLDRDGASEIFLRVLDDPSAPIPRSITRLLSARRGRVETYPPARGIPIDRLVDFDHDGRVDLATLGPYDAARVTSQGQLARPLLIAHGLSAGGFSFDDVARDQARIECPSTPSPILVRSENTIDTPRSMVNIACARLWKVPAAQILAEIARVCTPALACPDVVAMRAWATANPVFALTSPPLQAGPDAPLVYPPAP